MIKITNNSPMVELCDNYIKIDSLLLFTNMSESSADKLISLLNNNEKDYNVIIHLFDFYSDPSNITSGFNNLFKYLIYHNQYFLNHDFIIICQSEELYNVISDLIIDNQVEITATKELYPKIDKKTFLMLNESDNLESYLEIGEDILDFKFQLFSKYTEIELNKIEAEYDKDSELPEINFGTGFNSDNSISIIKDNAGFENNNYKNDNKIRLYQITIIDHNEFKFDLTLSHNNHYGYFMGIKHIEPIGDIIIDVFKNVKKTKKYMKNTDLNNLGLRAKITDKTS